jgi:hypothetical protein
MDYKLHSIKFGQKASNILRPPNVCHSVILFFSTVNSLSNNRFTFTNLEKTLGIWL